MARMPGAKWQPLASNFASQAKMRAYDIICIHTMVGGLVGTDGYFRTGNGVGYAGTESHFGTGGKGEIVQWQDTYYQAEANLNGNHRVLSIENADMGPGFPKWNTNDGAAVPAFTDEQCEAIAQIIAWACRVHDIPCQLIPDSKPGRRGIGFHRQGVPGYMVAGGEKWSNAQGKVCPGARRIAQIPGIIARAQQILAGGTSTTTANANTKENDDMSAQDVARIEGLLTRVAEQVSDVQGRVYSVHAGKFLPNGDLGVPGGTLEWLPEQVNLANSERKLNAVGGFADDEGKTYSRDEILLGAHAHAKRADAKADEALRLVGDVLNKVDQVLAKVSQAVPEKQ